MFNLACSEGMYTFHNKHAYHINHPLPHYMSHFRVETLLTLACMCFSIGFNL